MKIHAVLAILASFVFSFAQASNPPGLAEFVKATCDETIFLADDAYGRDFYLLTPRFDVSSDRMVSAIELPLEQKLKITIQDSHGKIETHLLPFFDFKGFLLIDNSIWFLQDNQLVEYDLGAKKITGNYPSYTKPFEVVLTTRARGFAYQDGRIYIAHGALGVVVFDIAKKAPVSVLNAGLQQASLAGAVALRGDTLFVLQGAYLPSGFNGISIFNFETGGTKTIKYPSYSGVVDPYSSTMQMNDDSLFINNSGWIHIYDLKSLARAPRSLAPSWLALNETVKSAGGNFPKFLMVNGDLVVSERTILACSSAYYTPVGERRPVREVRKIHVPDFTRLGR